MSAHDVLDAETAQEDDGKATVASTAASAAAASTTQCSATTRVDFASLFSGQLVSQQHF